jgi:hypothetical protein
MMAFAQVIDKSPYHSFNSEQANDQNGPVNGIA